MEILAEVLAIKLLNKESQAGILDHFDEEAELPHPDSLKRTRKRQMKAERKQAKNFDS
jgi:hypothetical protein